MCTTRCLVAVAALCVSTGAYAGSSRAWTAGKKVLPANLQMVAGANFDSIRGSQVFQKLLADGIRKHGAANEQLDKIKQQCNITLSDKLDSIVMGATASEHGVVVVALKSLTRKELDSCVLKVGKADKKTVTITQDGDFTRYAGITDKDVYLRWLGKDTFAMAASGEDRDLLAKMTDGGLADDKAFKAPLGAVSMSSSMWFALNKEQDLDQLSTKMKSAYGTADVKGGSINANLHIVTSDTKSATDAAAQATTQVDMLKQSGKVPAEYGPILNGVKFKGAGADLVIDAVLPEKDLLVLLTTFGH